MNEERKIIIPPKYPDPPAESLQNIRQSTLSLDEQVKKSGKMSRVALGISIASLAIAAASLVFAILTFIR